MEEENYIDWLRNECKLSTPEQLTKWLLDDVLRTRNKGVKYRTLLMAIQAQREAERELIKNERTETQS